MGRLRPGRTCREPKSQAWARYSLRKPRKNYVKALPHNSLLVFKMGSDNKDFDMTLTLNTDQAVQLRSNALEAARQTANKHLDENIPLNYLFKIMVYPHNVIRENKMATGSGADRISKGMTSPFGRPVSLAARLKENQPIFMIRTKRENKSVVVEALRKATYKLSGNYTIRAT